MIIKQRPIKKILLLLPPYTIPASMPKRVQPPLGIAYLGAFLEQKGYDVQLCDSLIEGFDHSEMIGDDLICYGLSVADIRKRVAAFKPDVVGISCLFTIQAQKAYQVCASIKDLDPDIVTVMGGAHPSAMTDEVLATGNVDFVVPGEGELTFYQLVQAIEKGEDLSKVGGIAYLQNNEMFRTAAADYIVNLDDLPLPARHLLPMEEYFIKDRPHGTATRHRRSTPMITSRGCPAKCTFCSIHTVWGREYRGRSAASVLTELRHLIENYGIKEVQIEDDNLTYSKPRATELLDAIIEADLGISFTTPNGIAAWVLDRPLLEKLKQAGFYRLTLAIESGSQRVLHDIIKKPLKLEKVKEIATICRELGFEIDTFFVVGFPGETKAEIQETFDFANSLDVDNAKFFVATPYPGTELYQTAKDKGYLHKDFDIHNANSFTRGQISTPDWTAEELESMVARATLRTQANFLRKKPVAYVKNIFQNYFLKEPSAILRYLYRNTKSAFKSQKQPLSKAS